MHYYGGHLVPGLSFENSKHNDHKCHTLYGEENLVILLLARIITYIIILIMVCIIEVVFIYLLFNYDVCTVPFSRIWIERAPNIVSRKQVIYIYISVCVQFG